MEDSVAVAAVRALLRVDFFTQGILFLESGSLVNEGFQTL